QADRIDQRFDLAEGELGVRIDDHDVRVQLAGHEQVEPPVSGHPAYPRNQPSPGSGVGTSGPGRASHGRPSSSTRSTSLASRDLPGPRRKPSRSPGARVAASAQTERPTATPLAPASQATRTCSL